jgi:hypothetical protein
MTAVLPPRELKLSGVDEQYFKQESNPYYDETQELLTNHNPKTKLVINPENTFNSGFEYGGSGGTRNTKNKSRE